MPGRAAADRAGDELEGPNDKGVMSERAGQSGGVGCELDAETEQREPDLDRQLSRGEQDCLGELPGVVSHRSGLSTSITPSSWVCPTHAGVRAAASSAPSCDAPPVCALVH